MAQTRSRSLRNVLVSLSSATAAVLVLALIMATALVVLTTLLRRTTVNLSEALESVRLTGEAEIELLLYERTRDPAARRELEAGLQSKLAEVGRFATTAFERELLSEPSAYAARHLATGGTTDDARFAAAQKALDTLRHLNTEKARSGEQRAADLDLLANILGTGVGVMVLAISGLIVWWMRLQVFRPILALGGVMERFGRGDRAARAEEVGPEELREMARRFNQMAAALAEQRDAQLAFLGGVAHDLRGPLFALRMSVAAVGPGRPLLPELRLRRMFALIDRQTVQLERMVGDLLDSARIEAGQLELRLERCDGRELVREIAEPFEGSSRLRLELSLSEPLRCDPLRVQQVLSNLLSNACKYSLPGGEVEVRLERVADDAVLAVTDHGIGLSAADQRHLFEPFRRLGPSRGHIPGVGLGLSVVRRIVDAHGGRVEVESAPGRGSSFRVYLPLAGPTGPRTPPQ